jgi:hypothetical protein
VPAQCGGQPAYWCRRQGYGPIVIDRKWEIIAVDKLQNDFKRLIRYGNRVRVSVEVEFRIVKEHEGSNAKKKHF